MRDRCVRWAALVVLLAGCLTAVSCTTVLNVLLALRSLLVIADARA